MSRRLIYLEPIDFIFELVLTINHAHKKSHFKLCTQIYQAVKYFLESSQCTLWQVNNVVYIVIGDR